ncbi:MAG: 3-isopropylmalate dehydratase large subunit [Candidatus Aminicenantales bacterium]
MTMTMTQKILAAHAGRKSVEPGELIEAACDLVLGNDITAPPAVAEFRKIGIARVFDQNRIALVMDHFTPNKDIKSAEQCKVVRDFAREQNIVHFYEGGGGGVEHVILPEKGLVGAGDLVIGADSHTCTYGALGAFSAGVGSTDMAAGMASGRCWFKVPEALRFELEGKLHPDVGGKDVILSIIGRIGVEGASYESMEFGGPGLGALTMDDRLTMANMAVEAGAKNGIFEVDDKTREYLRASGAKSRTEYHADADAVYAETLRIDLSSLKPVVAMPSSPANVRSADEIGRIDIDQVVIGSCTNGRISDLRIAARLLKGRKAAPGVRLLILPGSDLVYAQALKEGLLATFLMAGAVIGPPTCGPCLGGHMGVLAKGEKAVATTNRNFVGRMGHPESAVYLAGPAVAAASAVLGRIAAPSALSGK